jgi:acetyl-CoA carboxylase carboxyltransferase component
MLDSIVDVRTPRILLILRNAYGGAYASFNNYPTGADLVLALPTTRLAVMGPAGKEFVYKTELRKIRGAIKQMVAEGTQTRIKAGVEGAEAKRDAEAEAAEWLKNQEAELNLRYEKELMNPKEGLALGSISSLVMPTDLRKVLGENMNFLLRHYQPSTWQDVQREFH